MWQRDPQPAKAAIVLQNLTVRGIARRHSISEHFLGRVLNGYVPPTPRVVQILSEELGLPADELFNSSDRVAS